MRRFLGTAVFHWDADNPHIDPREMAADIEAAIRNAFPGISVKALVSEAGR